jgi:hypothetical protein
MKKTTSKSPPTCNYPKQFALCGGVGLLVVTFIALLQAQFGTKKPIHCDGLYRTQTVYCFVETNRYFFTNVSWVTNTVTVTNILVDDKRGTIYLTNLLNPYLGASVTNYYIQNITTNSPRPRPTYTVRIPCLDWEQTNCILVTNHSEFCNQIDFLENGRTQTFHAFAVPIVVTTNKIKL